jgi:PKD repeat protein/sugar lactone lactonase YvrE
MERKKAHGIKRTFLYLFIPVLYILPFSLSVTGADQAVELPSFSRQSPITSGLTAPTDVAVDAEGNIYVTESVNNRMRKFDKNGNPAGTPLTGLSTPKGVAVDANGDIFIGNDTANNVKVYNSAFNPIGTLDTSVLIPNAIEIDSFGKIYVVDTGMSKVMIFNPDLSLLTSFGVLGSGDGQLWFPNDLALDEVKREIVILDNGGPENVRIQAFDMDDYSWKRSFVQQYGRNNGEMEQPVGVEVDAEGRVYVSDSRKEGVQVFDGSNGDYLGPVYEDPHQLSNAVFLTISRDNQLYAVSSGLVNTVERYQLTMTAQDIDVNPISHDFGDITVGSSGNKIFIVKNVGTADLTITSAAVNEPFSVVTNTCGSPLASLDTCSIEVQFAPTNASSYGEDLVISSDDPDEGAFSVALSGSGITANIPPTADAGGPYTETDCNSVLLDGTGSSDTDGTIDQYEWDFEDDGTYDYISASPAHSHTYTQEGAYTIRLRVTDNAGSTAEATATAIISSPVAGFTASTTSGSAPLTVNFTDSSVFCDPITTYAWDFDFETNPGTATSTDQHPTHIYSTAGTYTVKLTVTDSGGGLGTLTRNNYIEVTAGGGCTGQPVRIEGTGVLHNTLQSAYSAAETGAVIQARASDSYTEDITLNFDKSITLRGGYDCNYTAIEGVTVLNGSITIESGTITLENIELQ